MLYFVGRDSHGTNDYLTLILIVMWIGTENIDNLCIHIAL